MGTVAYFTMEAAVRDDMPTYSGGLGVLAGDYLQAAADRGVPMVGVTLLYTNGYFVQQLDHQGHQSELPVEWDPSEVLERLDATVVVRINRHDVHIGVWRLMLTGSTGCLVPVYFLDTDLEENEIHDREITDQLYGGDLRHRLRQEVVLGIGGVKMLEALGHRVTTFHMNEGHSSLLALELVSHLADHRVDEIPAALSRVREHCVFTTHTPVPAGHDRFGSELVERVVGQRATAALRSMDAFEGDELNMTQLGMRASRFTNAVSLRHGLVAREMFPQSSISAITNGVQASTWASPDMAALFDRSLGPWREDSTILRDASQIPLDEITAAHRAAKQALIDELVERDVNDCSLDVFTIGVARRATEYKRTDLLFQDLERLREICRAHGPLQVIFAGKAHPKDQPGKRMIRRVFEAAERLGDEVRVVWIEGYDLALGRLLTAGSDVWLNTPTKPHEASGTSGMKAAVNGVPSLSVLDGWWLEGCVDGVTGWSVGDGTLFGDDTAEAHSLYERLDQAVLPLYYENPVGYAEVRRNSISINGSYFNTHRMLDQYVAQAYSTVVPGDAATR